MKKVIIILVLFVLSACTSGNMYHPVHGQDYRSYLWDKEDCELKAQLGGQAYRECMGEWKEVRR